MDEGEDPTRPKFLANFGKTASLTYERSKELFDELSSAVSSGHSLGLSVCYAAIAANLRGSSAGVLGTEFTGKEQCGTHAIVLNAMRWNPSSNLCEIHIKNSHGKNTVFASNWYPADKVLPHVFTTFHLKTEDKN